MATPSAARPRRSLAESRALIFEGARDPTVDIEGLGNTLGAVAEAMCNGPISRP